MSVNPGRCNDRQSKIRLQRDNLAVARYFHTLWSIKFGRLMQREVNEVMWGETIFLGFCERILPMLGSKPFFRYACSGFVMTSPFLTGCMVWDSTYATNVKPIEILQKRTIRIISFTTPLFAKFKLLKLQDIITLYATCSVHNFHNSKIPNFFNS